MKQTTVTNDCGEIVTRINVTHVFSYDIETIIEQLLEDNQGGEGVEFTLDDVIERISLQAQEDFAYYDAKSLIYQDQEGNDL